MNPMPLNTKVPVGIRVFAYGARTPNTIDVYGRGVYAGIRTRADGTLDHQIDLDDGGVVWGSEVNWVNEVWEGTATAGRRQVDVRTPSDLLTA